MSEDVYEAQNTKKTLCLYVAFACGKRSYVLAPSMTVASNVAAAEHGPCRVYAADPDTGAELLRRAREIAGAALYDAKSW